MTVVADEAYIRESILMPNAKLVAGYQAIMPSFQGQVSEEQILQLIAYLKSIGPKQDGSTPTMATQASSTAGAPDGRSPMTPAAPNAPSTN
jgi:cytochrome c oxidase subunit 2